VTNPPPKKKQQKKTTKNARKEFLMAASLQKYVLSNVKILTKMTST